MERGDFGTSKGGFPPRLSISIILRMGWAYVNDPRGFGIVNDKICTRELDRALSSSRTVFFLFCSALQLVPWGFSLFPPSPSNPVPLFIPVFSPFFFFIPFTSLFNSLTVLSLNTKHVKCQREFQTCRSLVCRFLCTLDMGEKTKEGGGFFGEKRSFWVQRKFEFFLWQSVMMYRAEM